MPLRPPLTTILIALISLGMPCCHACSLAVVLPDHVGQTQDALWHVRLGRRRLQLFQLKRLLWSLYFNLRK